MEGDPNDGYIIIWPWPGHPEGEPRQHGVGLAVRNCHVKKIDEEPNYINERLMTLRVPLIAMNEHMLLVCVYARPTSILKYLWFE